jgi:hypothetical protein
MKLKDYIETASRIELIEDELSILDSNNVFERKRISILKLCLLVILDDIKRLETPKLRIIK